MNSRSFIALAGAVTHARVGAAGCILAWAAAAAAGCGPHDAEGETVRPPDGMPAPVSADAAFRAMLSVEDTIAELTPHLHRLSRSVRNLQLPDALSRELFTHDAVAVDLAADISGFSSADSLGLRTAALAPSTEPAALSDIRGGLWSPLWRVAHAFRKAKFGVIRGEAVSEHEFRLELAFDGRGRDVRGGPVSVSGPVTVDWERSGADGAWKIRRWETGAVTIQTADSPLFQESLRSAIPDAAEYLKARTSVHHGYIRDVFLTGGTTFHYPKHYWPYVVSWDSLDQHPSAAVVDIDRDGWDDIYVTARWGRNQLWRNRGDGTFEDVASRWGIDIDGVCNAALFADFDNDGDDDLFLGRSLERGRYFINHGTFFSDATDTHLDFPLPFWTSSLAAADYNGDGLLDVYLSTYRLPITKPQNILGSEFLSPDEQDEWKRRRADDHPVFRLTGPPNLLLVNRGGGRFEVAPESDSLELWLSSFQSTWSDFDNDGDPDLFVASDYAPDFIFRNDDPPEGSDGARVFTDVTRALAGDELQGFGMGVSLGDYDNDSRQDVFFTYMFSKAGSRITAMFGGLEERMYAGARGNKLFRSAGDSLQLVSGLEPPALTVARTGWSWGGQFFDADCDGFLDLYVSNGYYSPPDEAATDVDL